MKTQIQATLVAAVSLLLPTVPVLAQGTAFTYQGRLNDGANIADGIYDLRFAIYDASGGGNLVAGPLTNSATAVSNGLFTVVLDFNAGVFGGAARWLQIGVRTNGAANFTDLAPRQTLTPSPYAIYAGGVNAAGINGIIPTASLGGIYGNPITLDNPTNQFAGNGGGLTALNASQLTSGTVPAAALGNAWRTIGNAGTTAGANFLGTTDNQPLHLVVNGQRVLRLEPNTELAPNFIAGASVNFVTPGVVGASIGGGGALNYLGLGAVESNSVFADFGTIGGGWSNVVRNTAVSGTIGGGFANVVDGPDATVAGGNGNVAGGSRATITGGLNNTAGGDWGFIGGGGGNTAGNTYAVVAGGSGNGVFGQYSVVGGGSGNLVDVGAERSVIAGGQNNVIGLNWANISGGQQNTNIGTYSAIGGGRYNMIDVFADYSFIPGGRNNTVAADYAFAGGRRAQANHNGAFVWADDTDADFASLAADEFAVRAAGGARIVGSSTLGSFLVAPNETVSGDDSQIFLAEDHDGTFGMVLRYDGGVNQLQVFGENLGLSGPHLVIERDSGDVGIKRSPAANDLEVEGTASKTAAGSWLANSDARIKQDIQPVGDALKVLSRVRLVSFRYTDDYQRSHPSLENRRYLNVVAQEFREVFPDHVKSSGETLPDGSEILQVDTYPLTIYSAAAIQELNGQLKQLQGEMKRRDAENEALKQRLEKLERLLARNTE